MSVLILQNEIVHYEVLGRGKPLLFLHGWVGSWRYWMPVMQAASISFRTYALDLWGFGDTAKDISRYSLDQQVGLVDLFMQEMGIAKIALIGHGLGAVVAARYAIQNPRWVDRLLAVSMPDGGQAIHPRLNTTTPAELADWLLARSPDSNAARAEAPKTDGRAVQLSLADLSGSDLSTLTQKLETPCLLVHGQNDPAIPPSAAPDPASSYPEHIHQIIFEASGHFPMLDEPIKFNRLLSDFLALASGVTPRQLQLKDEWKRRVR